MEPTPVDPVGEPKTETIKDKIDDLIKLWRDNNPIPGWFGRIKGSWFTAVKFILKATDYLIRLVEEKLIPGPDKKATVLSALSTVYDAIVPVLLPIVLKPFNGKLKTFVIEVVASLLIDFIVSKYNSGTWRTAPATMTFTDFENFRTGSSS